VPIGGIDDSPESFHLKSTLALSPAPVKELTRYLEAFPAEAGALGVLASQLAETPAELLRRENLRVGLTTSALVLNLQKTHFLAVRPHTLSVWLPPGGPYEGKGSMFSSAVRSVAEKTGVEGASALRIVNGSGLLDVEAPAVPENSVMDERGLIRHDFMYLAVAPFGASPMPRVEAVAEARWLPLADLRELGNPRLVRIAKKLDALFCVPGAPGCATPSTSTADATRNDEAYPDEGEGPDESGTDEQRLELTVEDLADLPMFR